MISILKYFNYFGELFFPRNCIVCGTRLIEKEHLFCTECIYNLPRTNFHTINNNPVSKLFWGIVKIEYATAYFYYGKGSKYQKLIHNLKYKGQKEIGFELGKLHASEINKSNFNKIDVIVPVPLHPLRRRKRGYNQSELIANGMQEILDKPVDNKTLIRKVYTETQTKKNAEERRKNVESVFEITNHKTFENKHILLIDDVVTTGSTLIACATEILKIPGTKVSISTLAAAMDS